MTIHHKDLFISDKWFAYSLMKQLANIGSEVYRSIRWFRKKNSEKFQNAFERALELFDLTLEDNRWKGRRKEICRSREIFCSLMLEPEKYSNHEAELNSLDKYFYYFAIAANKEKNKD
jgi:hypothetical protein